MSVTSGNQYSEKWVKKRYYSLRILVSFLFIFLRLQVEVARLRRLVVSGATGILNERKPPEGEGTDPASYALEIELQLAKEALTSKLNITNNISN